MSPLSDSAVASLDAFWADETGCDPGDFHATAMLIAERRAADGSQYVRLFRRRQHLQVTCSPALATAVRDVVRDREPHHVFTASFWQQALAGRVERVVGPAYLGYRDTLEEEPSDPDARLLLPEDSAAVDEFRRGVAAQDWEHSGLEVGQPMSGCFVSGALVAAAGYEVWGERLAHIGVVTRADVRGAGYGRACVRAIGRQAIAEGLIAQYQTLHANRAAMAVARRLRFEDYADTLYICVAAT
jgi:hypothetical protein